MPHPKPTDFDMTKHSDYFVWKDTSEHVARRCDNTVDKKQVNSCVLKHLFLEGVEQPKIWPKKPENALSDALLMSRFQNFAADAAKKLRSTRFDLIRGQRFWEVIFFTALQCMYHRENKRAKGNHTFNFVFFEPNSPRFWEVWRFMSTICFFLLVCWVIVKHICVQCCVTWCRAQMKCNGTYTTHISAYQTSCYRRSAIICLIWYMWCLRLYICFLTHYLINFCS